MKKKLKIKSIIKERQLFGDPEQECAYGSIETKVLFNNSLQGIAFIS